MTLAFYQFGKIPLLQGFSFFWRPIYPVSYLSRVSLIRGPTFPEFHLSEIQTIYGSHLSTVPTHPEFHFFGVPPITGVPLIRISTWDFYFRSDTNTNLILFSFTGNISTLCFYNYRLGYLTLKDFKGLVNRPGRYRYYFKSKDKDFGFVREEVS